MDNNKWIVIKPSGDDCKTLKLKLVYQSSAGGYRVYIYRIDTAVYIEDIIHLRAYFDVQCSNGTGFQEWYPCGGVWLGLGTPDAWITDQELSGENWFWTGTRGPYAVIGDQQDYDCNKEGGVAGHMGIAPESADPVNLNIWCIKDAFEIFTWFSGIEPGTQIKYLQFHIRTNSSLYWSDNGLGSELMKVRGCIGENSHLCEE